MNCVDMIALIYKVIITLVDWSYHVNAIHSIIE